MLPKEEKTMRLEMNEWESETSKELTTEETPNCKSARASEITELAHHASLTFFTTLTILVVALLLALVFVCGAMTLQEAEEALLKTKLYKKSSTESRYSVKQVIGVGSTPHIFVLDPEANRKAMRTGTALAKPTVTTRCCVPHRLPMQLQRLLKYP
jgi:hypothetical protein